MRTILPTNPDNYLTQKEEVDILSRIVSQSVYTPDDDTSEWREITPEEAADILKQQEEAQPDPPTTEEANDILAQQEEATEQPTTDTE